jgi:hypothetical protein
MLHAILLLNHEGDLILCRRPAYDLSQSHLAGTFETWMARLISDQLLVDTDGLGPKDHHFSLNVQSAM